MSRKKGTSFRQYIECSVCRMHHNLGTKHLYTTQHKKNLKIVLKKSIGKIAEGKKHMKDPEVHEENWEKEKTFWCYFCSKEYPKHGHSNVLTVNGLGMVNHFTDHAHFENVKKFLKANRVTNAAEKYIVKKSDLLSFLELVPPAEAKYLKKMEVIHQTYVSRISEAEKQRSDLVLQVSCETELVQASTSYANYASNSNSKIVTGTQAGSSIVVGDRKIPPWLLPADARTCIVTSSMTRSDVNHAPVIGPSMDDLQEHIKKQQKKKLNPKRVGADFNHDANSSASWLPSFGRVWNQGRRKQSQIQFLHKRKKIQRSLD